MKKTLLIILIFFTMMSAYSQTEKGKKFIGGQIQLSINTSNSLDTLSSSESSGFSYYISPNFGYFIKNNLAIGANIRFSGTHYENSFKQSLHNPSEGTKESNSTTIGVGVFAKYYIKISDKFSFYVNGNATFDYQKYNSTLTDNDTIQNYTNKSELNSKSINISISPGFVYFITPKLGMEASIGSIYYHYSTTSDEKLLFDNYNRYSGFGLDFDITKIYFGLNYYF